MALAPDARRRFARHLSLAEVGEAGQERLSAAPMPELAGDPRAVAVARLYLERAGLDGGERDGAVIDAGSRARVRALAGSEGLEEAAAFVLGAFAAVEHLKHVLEVGRAGVIDAGLTLGPEDRA